MVHVVRVFQGLRDQVDVQQNHHQRVGLHELVEPVARSAGEKTENHYLSYGRYAWVKQIEIRRRQYTTK